MKLLERNYIHHYLLSNFIAMFSKKSKIRVSKSFFQTKRTSFHTTVYCIVYSVQCIRTVKWKRKRLKKIPVFLLEAKRYCRNLFSVSLNLEMKGGPLHKSLTLDTIKEHSKVILASVEDLGEMLKLAYPFVQYSTQYM